MYMYMRHTQELGQVVGYTIKKYRRECVYSTCTYTFALYCITIHIVVYLLMIDY